ncbi:YecH family protein [Photobacterium japonica]|uniref:YecH family metal-binding protein n=1 Tax=Photobacterium japonica TaxID=2910235 RepID=UPI003D12B349
MMTQVHAHNVLNMLLAAETPYTRESLTQAVEAEYGEAVRFHTCSQEGLTLEALLTFLLDRRKVVQDGDILMANPERMCNH